VVRVLVCDDYPLFRRRVMVALEATADVEVVAEAADNDLAVTLARSLVPDVVLLGMRLPHLGGVRAAADLRRAVPTAAIVMVVTPDDEQTIVPAIGAGATCFVLRDVVIDQGAAVARAAVAGRCLLLPAAAQAVLAAYDDAARRPSTSAVQWQPHTTIPGSMATSLRSPPQAPCVR